MKRSICCLLILLAWPAAVFAGQLSLTPEAVVNGGIALLELRGEAPAAAVGRFNDRVFYLTPGRGGAFALIGADVQLPPGRYPVEVGVVDRRGMTTLHRLELEVAEAQRPVERLKLPPAMVTPREPQVLARIERERALLAAVFAGESSRFLGEKFVRPVDDPVGSIFGLRRILNGEPRAPHSGVDFRSPRGTPVRAAARGRVVLADDLYYLGRVVILDHGDGLFTTYAHLERIDCRPDQLLEPGDQLGLVGSTGRSTGPHLHWGVNLRGARVDPLLLLNMLGEKP